MCVRKNKNLRIENTNTHKQLFLPEKLFYCSTKNEEDDTCFIKILNILIHYRHNRQQNQLKAFEWKTFVYILLSSKCIKRVLCTNIVHATESVVFLSLPFLLVYTNTYTGWCVNMHTRCLLTMRASDATCWMLCGKCTAHMCAYIRCGCGTHSVRWLMSSIYDL